jgi:hypothetical protein
MSKRTDRYDVLRRFDFEGRSWRPGEVFNVAHVARPTIAALIAQGCLVAPLPIAYVLKPFLWSGENVRAGDMFDPRAHGCSPAPYRSLEQQGRIAPTEHTP